MKQGKDDPQKNGPGRPRDSAEALLAAGPAARPLVRVLLIEDSATDALLLRRTLEGVNWAEVTATEAGTLAAGQELLAREKFDLVLLDLGLPDSQGLDTFFALRKHATEMPIVVLTVLHDESAGMEAVTRGAQDYLIKGQCPPPVLGRSLRYALERDRAAKQAREGELRLSSIIGSAMDAIVSTDEQQRVTLFNPAAEKMFGCPAPEAMGKPLDTFIPRRFRAAHAAQMHEFGASNSTRRSMGDLGRIYGLRANGQEFPIEASISHADVAGSKVFTVILRDITARETAEAANAQLAAIVDYSDDAIIGKTLEGIITSWNRGATRVFGYTAQEAIGQPLRLLIPPERADEEPAILARLRRGQNVDHFETVRVRKDGTRIHISATISAVKDPSGRVIGVSKIARDITERKIAEGKAQDQLMRLNLLNQITRAIGDRLDVSSIHGVVLGSLERDLGLDFGCICDYDAERGELQVAHARAQSQMLAQDLGLTKAARIPIEADEFTRAVSGQLVYQPDLRERTLAFPQRLARAGLCSLVIAPLQVESKVFGTLLVARRAANAFSSGECEFLRQLCEHAALATHQAQLHEALQRAYEEMRQTQQAVMQQERLRALGQMASGIAHDINNAISPIAMYTESMLETEPNLTDKGKHHLEIMRRAIEDVAQTIARLREFYREQEPATNLVATDINTLIAQVTELTRARWCDLPQKKGLVIEMKAELAPGLPAILAVESEIREALINLIFNAVDAMPEGGTLTLRTRQEQGAAERAGANPARLVVVEVRDTGAGMDEETRRRCMEPFYTTKGPRGTGLGLAMVFGTAQRHEAEMEIESVPGKGTTVRLKFAATGSATPEGSVQDVLRAPLLRLRILIVDDDPVLLRSLTEILLTDGHTVEAASGGAAGIEAFRAAKKRGKPFAVVVTDLGMPRVSGREVASAVKAVSPSTPVILLTGWGRRLTAEGDIPPHVDRVLSKPPKLRELRQALMECSSSQPNTPAALPTLHSGR